MFVDLALAVAQIDQRLDDGQDFFLAQSAMGVGGVELEAHVHLDAATADRFVGSESKNSDWNMDCAASMVGGSPGRITR